MFQPVTRRLLVALVATATAIGAVSSTAGAQTPPGRAADRPPQVLDHDRHGEDAIRALGDRLPEVASMNGKTAAQLRSALRADPELWVGQTGRLLFVDDHLDQGATATGPESAALADAPLSDTFVLHSRPGSNRVIYLDFDGHDYSGSGWTYGPGVAEPYSQDGDPTTFNDSERATIQSIWQRIAEDYAPFDIDVTTQDPGAGAIRRDSSSDLTYGTRLVVTPTKTYDCSCGGVAYVGVFDSTGSTHDYYQPAWVFTGGVGTGAKTVAEAASHEIGHNLGLSHDGTQTTGYYSGQGDWAPIMGVGYYKAITQWSRGEYAGADNTEDDFAVMRGHGAPLMTDDHGNTAASATPVSGPTFSVDGLIHTAADVDAFTFTTAGGAVTLQATPAPVSPDLDIAITLRDGNGATVAVADPRSGSTSGDDATGLDASLDLTLAAGSYTVLVDGAGAGDPLSTGYSDYGSLGRYTLTGTLPDGTSSTNQPPTATAAALSDTSGPASLTVTVTGDGSTDPDGDTLSYRWTLGSTDLGTASTVSHTFDTPGTYELVLTVSDGSATDTDSILVTVTDPQVATPPSAPTDVSATASADAVTVSWVDNAVDETGFEVVREFLHKNGQWRGTTVVGTVGPDTTTFDDTGVSTGSYRYLVRAVNGAGSTDSQWSARVDVTTSGGGGGGKPSGKGNGKGGKA